MKVKTNEEHYATSDEARTAFLRFCSSSQTGGAPKDCYGCPMKFIREDLSCYERWKKMEYKEMEGK